MNLEFSSHRSPVYGTKGMVAASQPLAVAAGLKILAQGGNAADAAIATAAALNVTEPNSTGLGGDAFALFYDAQTKSIHALNGSGRAPAGLSLDLVKRSGFEAGIPYGHPYTITVPGACAAWYDLIDRFGKLSFREILQPAIELAEEGFPVSPLTSYFWQAGATNQLAKTAHGSELTINGQGPSAGEVFRNPNLAKTMQIIAEKGKKAFYQGEIAEVIVKEIREAGGVMTMEDLACHSSTWEEPISTSYRGFNIWECAPNGQGITALIALNILEGFDLTALEPLSPERLHLEIEAMRLAFADARQYISDPNFEHIPVTHLLSKEYAETRRQLIDLKSSKKNIQFGYPLASSDTVYLSVVDGEGNACSFINSIYMEFGSGIVPAGTGFCLQNRGANFSLDPSHPNHLEPQKRPYHTIIPAMATSANGNLYASFGVMGGFMQPQGHVQVAIALFDDQLDPQSTLDRPRFCINAEDAPNQVLIEEGIPEKTISALAQMEHETFRIQGMDRSVFGRGQVIIRDASTGVLTAGSDPRADGCAMPLG